jgi:hypothetical protein
MAISRGEAAKEGPMIKTATKRETGEALPAHHVRQSLWGALYVGVKESDDDPRRSCGITPLARVFELEIALCDAMRDTIEPPCATRTLLLLKARKLLMSGLSFTTMYFGRDFRRLFCNVAHSITTT